jgi:hypothetical protein
MGPYRVKVRINHRWARSARLVQLVDSARTSMHGSSAMKQHAITISGHSGGRGWSAAIMASPASYGTAVEAWPSPTAAPTNPSSHGRSRIAAMAHPGAVDWATSGQNAKPAKISRSAVIQVVPPAHQSVDEVGSTPADECPVDPTARNQETTTR